MLIALTSKPKTIQLNLFLHFVLEGMRLQLDRVTLYVDGFEGHGRANVFATTAAYTNIGINRGNRQHTLVRHHFYRLGGAMF